MASIVWVGKTISPCNVKEGIMELMEIGLLMSVQTLNIQKSICPQISQKTLSSKKALGNALRVDSMGGIIFENLVVSAHCKLGIITREIPLLMWALSY